MHLKYQNEILVDTFLIFLFQRMFGTHQKTHAKLTEKYNDNNINKREYETKQLKFDSQ